MHLNSSISNPEQPEILLQLRQKSAQLRQAHASLKDENKQLTQAFANYSDRLDVLLK